MTLLKNLVGKDVTIAFPKGHIMEAWVSSPLEEEETYGVLSGHLNEVEDFAGGERFLLTVRRPRSRGVDDIGIFTYTSSLSISIEQRNEVPKAEGVEASGDGDEEEVEVEAAAPKKSSSKKKTNKKKR